MKKNRQHYEPYKGKNQYRKITPDGRVSYETYTYYPENRTMVINK